MARRKKTSPAEDVIDLVSLLPWWAGVLLAALVYLLLHGIAAKPLVVVTQPGQVPLMITDTLWKSLASVGQYLAPMLFLAGAVLSAVRRKRRANLVVDVAQNKAAGALDGMSWHEFELLVGEAFRLQGYKVFELGGSGPDGGVDLVLTKPSRNGDEKFLVQCKQWRAFKVGVDVVRELYGVMAARGATGGFVVTSGRFTQEAERFASGRNVTLVDGPRLRGLIEQVQRARRDHRAEPSIPAPVETPARPTGAVCPLCSKPMLRRLAKRGPNAGGAFWGCTGYPACRGTRPIA
jgi:restriction system protein